MKPATSIVTILIVVAVLIPGKNLPDVSLINYDKFAHVLMFATWAIAFRYDLRESTYRPIVVFLTGLVFSLLTEVLQLLVEGRSFDFFDVAADIAGLSVGMLVGGFVVRYFKNR